MLGGYFILPHPVVQFYNKNKNTKTAVYTHVYRHAPKRANNITSIIIISSSTSPMSLRRSSSITVHDFCCFVRCATFCMSPLITCVYSAYLYIYICCFICFICNVIFNHYESLQEQSSLYTMFKVHSFT